MSLVLPFSWTGDLDLVLASVSSFAFGLGDLTVGLLALTVGPLGVGDLPRLRGVSDSDWEPDPEPDGEEFLVFSDCVREGAL